MAEKIEYLMITEDQLREAFWSAFHQKKFRFDCDAETLFAWRRLVHEINRGSDKK